MQTEVSQGSRSVLAKQAWRVLSSHDLLAVRVLKAKYFSQVDSRCSYQSGLLSHLEKFDLSLNGIGIWRSYISVLCEQWVPDSLGGKVSEFCLKSFSDKQVVENSMEAKNPVKEFSLDDIKVLCMISWVVWESRNSLLSCGKSKDPESVVGWITDLLVEFIN
ncbi:hypothetical protein Ddye_022626 [Dipteronia dyeriana]|uniref:Uncharacterized protein n=1 Tax=Dipteronia dyeriana TaxID=168575 RepID=A0AAD9WSI4_9ROSI|nr:hypothetical protein Ddye_022626 [Dipteronia dyeriana]